MHLGRSNTGSTVLRKRGYLDLSTWSDQADHPALGMSSFASWRESFGGLPWMLGWEPIFGTARPYPSSSRRGMVSLWERDNASVSSASWDSGCENRGR